MKLLKLCNRCRELKPIEEFSKNKSKKDNLDIKCKECNKIHCREYFRTKEGLLHKIYNNQKAKSKRRGHAEPDYSFQELKEFAISNPEFHILYTHWVVSKYDMSLVPSFDRLDDYASYSLNNLRLVTWEVNNKRGSDDIRNGINNKQSRAIVRIDPITKEEIVFYSISEASRVTNCNRGNIHSVLKGVYKTCGGFKWVYGD